MLDALIATIHPEDGSARDVCKALVPNFKEPNAIVIKGRTDTTALVRVNFGGLVTRNLRVHLRAPFLL